MPDRLSIADCRVGMRVDWADQHVAPVTTITFVGDWGVQVAGHVGVYHPSNFIPADPAPQPAMTAELVAALRWWARFEKDRLFESEDSSIRSWQLLNAAKRAGILAEPAPRVTDVQAQIAEMWWV